MKQDRLATLTVSATTGGPAPADIRAALLAGHYKILSCATIETAGGENQETTWQLAWRAGAHDHTIPALVQSLAQRAGVLKVAWTPRES